MGHHHIAGWAKHIAGVAIRPITFNSLTAGWASLTAGWASLTVGWASLSADWASLRTRPLFSYNNHQGMLVKPSPKYNWILPKWIPSNRQIGSLLKLLS